MSKEEFYKLWEDSSREDILNQYYYDRKELMDTIDKAKEYIYELTYELVDEEDYPLGRYEKEDFDIEELYNILKGE